MFGKIHEVAEMPNLIEVQKQSYDQFLMVEEPEGGRGDEGLQAVFRSVFPIKDFGDRAQLEFVRYAFEQPKYDVEECQQRGMTFAAPLKVTLRLIVFDVNEETGARSVKDIKEQDVYMGDMPLMTMNGTFVINGTERVIVSQMHRSPGVFFDHDRGKTHSSGKLLFAARIIPYRGSWLDFEFDAKDIVYVRIDRRRKLPATSLLYALGYDDEEILNLFYDRIELTADKKGGWKMPFVPEKIRGVRYPEGLDAGRQSHDEAGPAVRGKLGPYLPTMQLDNLPADIQPQSQPLRGILGAGLEEALEDPIACLDRNADAMIADGKLESAGQRLGERHDDRLSMGAVLDGVIEEIGEDLLEPQRVDPGLH